MRYRLLGRSGLRVSELCLGTMTFGGPHAGATVDAEAARLQFDAFRDSGGNFIDTANMYSRGDSERIVADLIGANRDEIVLGSKFTMSMNPDDPNAGGSAKKNLVQALDASLKRLSTDRIDLYWVHANDPHTPLAETMRALDDAVRAGKILYIGISNMPAWRVAQAQMLCERNGWTPVTALQLQYSLVERSIEAEHVPMAETLGIGITAWSPLGGGVLTGKYAGEAHATPRGRLEAIPGYGALLLTDRNRAIADASGSVAKKHGVSSAQVALAWLVQKGTIPIVGATSQSQLEDNLSAAELSLDESDMENLDRVSEPALYYPHTLWPRINDMQFGTIHDKLIT